MGRSRQLVELFRQLGDDDQQTVLEVARALGACMPVAFCCTGERVAVFGWQASDVEASKAGQALHGLIEAIGTGRPLHVHWHFTDGQVEASGSMRGLQ